VFKGFRFPSRDHRAGGALVPAGRPLDETYVKVAGRWRYVYRAVDQYGQVIDVYVSTSE
jgi:DDE domain